MENMMQLALDLICERFSVGQSISEPVRLTGGLLHETWQLRTTTESYVLKRLNPEIMRRPEARNNFKLSEDVAMQASLYLEALPARCVNDQAVQTIDGSDYLLFDWVDGKTLSTEQIRPIHARHIGVQLGRLHGLSMATTGFSKPDTSSVPIDWNGYIEEGKRQQSEWLYILMDEQEQLQRLERLAQEARLQLPTDWIVSHRDLDPKNVLWTMNGPVLIDWESAGLIHRAVDAFETACYWSKRGDDTLDSDRFSAFFDGYQTEQSLPIVDWIYVIDISVQGKLDWLKFNLDRSLGKDGIPEAERVLGTEQVLLTIKELQVHDRNLWIKWMLAR
ncbi:phosphotransferase [Exiguobacterium acetylicum]|uniref:phosphotransferase n=1 Tax=Exiguobacterium acetylicum TaxID=41170 RepID=UPI001EE3207A|nr:phosphotransferase [Exiguobacterium acetylicum]UKS54698.1 phosphotransferase [Exiguobacterium acetylicum]